MLGGALGDNVKILCLLILRGRDWYKVVVGGGGGGGENAAPTPVLYLFV